MIEIKRKDDIVIPFVNIGSEGWDTTTRSLLEAIAENWGNELKEPVSASALAALKARLGTTLLDSLKLFYQTFGLTDIGEQLQELDDIGWIRDIWADAPQYGPDFTEEDKRQLPYLVSFSDYLGNGNLFCFHSETKEIYYYDYDQRPCITKMFDSVDDYLKGYLLFAQGDLFSEEVGQEKVEQWVTEIVIGLVGERIIKKWRC